MGLVRAGVLAAMVWLGPIAAAAAQQAGPATAWVELHAGRARLVAGAGPTADGHILAGLEVVLADGWKTYWRMPGDSGVPPNFDWAGSVNLARAKVLYPAPLRMAEGGGEAIGYKRAVLLPIEVRPQNAAKAVTVKLALELGICREICIPAMAAFNLTIAPGHAGPQPAAIAAALERVPRPQASRRKDDPDLRAVAVLGQGAGARLSIEAAFAGKAVDVFIEAPEGLYVPLPKEVGQQAGGVHRFEAPLSADLAQDLKGKTLTLTLVDDAGATEAHWTLQ